MTTRRLTQKSSRYGSMKRGTSTASFRSVSDYAPNPVLRKHGSQGLLRHSPHDPVGMVRNDSFGSHGSGRGSPLAYGAGGGYSSSPLAMGSSPRAGGKYSRRKFHPKLKVLKNAVSSPTLSTLSTRHIDGDSALASARSNNPRRKRIENSLTFPMDDRTNDKSMAALLADWLVNMGEQSQGYTSVALYLEVKLAEIESLTGNSERPNRIRTAVFFALFEMLIDRLRSFAPVLVPVSVDMLSSVYTKRSLDESGLRLKYASMNSATQLSTQELLETLLGSESYFQQVHELRAELETQQSRFDAELRNEIAQARTDARLRVKQARTEALLLCSMFHNWRYAVQMKRQREILEGMPREGDGKATLRDVFMAWYAQSQRNRAQRAAQAASDNKTQMDEHVINLEQERIAHMRTRAKMQSFTGQLEEAWMGNAALQDTVNQQQQAIQQSRSEIEDLRTEVKRLKQVLVASGQALKAVGSGMVDSLRTQLKEVQVKPDATLLEKLITNKEMQPDLYQKEEYNYGGDGKTEGVGTDAPPQAPAPPPKSSPPEWNKSTRKGSVGPPGPRSRSKSGARNSSAGGSDAFSEEDLHREQAEIMLAAKLAPEAPMPVRDPKARRSRALEVLQRLPGDETLMRWVNFHVGNSVVNGEPFTKRLHNFASDIADGEVLAALVSQIVQYRDHTKMLAVMDPFRRCELVVETCKNALPGASDFATAVHIARGDAQIVTALVGRLFATHPGLSPPVEVLRPLFKAFNDMVEDWGDVADILVAIGSESTVLSSSDWLVTGVSGSEVTIVPASTVKPGVAADEEGGGKTEAAPAVAVEKSIARAAADRLKAMDEADAKAAALTATLAVPGAANFNDVSAAALRHVNGVKMRDMVVSRLRMPEPQHRSDGFATVVQGHRACPPPAPPAKRRSSKRRTSGEQSRRRESAARSRLASSDAGGAGSRSTTPATASAPPVTTVTLGFDRVTESQRVTDFCVEKLLSFAHRVNKAHSLIGNAAVLSREGFDTFVMLKQRVIEHIWRVFRNKLLMVEEEVKDEREARGLSEYTTLHPAKYKDLLDKHTKSQEQANQQIFQMEALLKEHRTTLAKIFQYYCASGDGSSISTMSTGDYWALLKDCRLASKGFGDPKSARLDLIFAKCNQRIGLPDENEHNPDKELIPRQYVEALIRVAVLQYEGKSPVLSLSQCLQRLLENYVLPHGTQSNTEEFREELASDAVREVFHNHRIGLQRVFLAYASNGMSLKAADFMKLLRDCQLMDKGALTPLQVKHIFAHTQLEETFLDDTCVGGGEEDMVYSEFLEGIAAVSLTKICTPYITLAKRIDQFLADIVLVKAKQKYPRASKKGGRGKKGSVVAASAAGAGGAGAGSYTPRGNGGGYTPRSGPGD